MTSDEMFLRCFGGVEQNSLTNILKGNDGSVEKLTNDEINYIEHYLL